MATGLIPQVRASALQNYANVARFVGIDPVEMLGNCKIYPRDIANPENRIPASAMVRLYEDSAAASGREDFGLLMAECRSFASLGPMSLLLKYQPTVRAIIEQVIANIRLLNDINEPRLEDDGAFATIRMELAPGFALRQAVEMGVASACRIYREIMAGAWQPERIHFRHSAPVSLATHSRVFRCRIEFESEFDGIVCSSASLDIPNPWNDPAMAAHAQRFIGLLSQQRASSSITEQARQAIFLLLGGGNATMEKVAKNLGVHPRTLQRLLNGEETNFGALLGEARRELALRYLNGSKQSVTEIAMLLGYSTISSFTRWFTEEFGKSPAAWRKTPPEEVIALLAPKAA